MDAHRIKKLIHRANYRGFKEADLILGGFARAHAESLNELEIDQFEQLLAQRDHDIYDWVSGAQPTPEQFQTSLFAKICAYKPLAD